MAYTEEDKAAFARKDRMIVAQTCLERAIETVALKHVDGYDCNEIVNIAGQYYDWVFGQANQTILTEEVNGGTNSNTDSSSNVLPIATKQQLEWLKKIKDKYGYTKEDIWKKCNMYPGNKDEAVVVTKLMKG